MADGAKQCLAAHGIPFEKRQAAIFSVQDYFEYDIIVCMDEWSKFNVQMKCHNDPHNKICKLLEFSRSTNGMNSDDAMIFTNVSDPFYSGDCEKTFAEIFEGCEKLKERI